jgi:hypothetical protein
MHVEASEIQKLVNCFGEESTSKSEKAVISVQLQYCSIVPFCIGSGVEMDPVCVQSRPMHCVRINSQYEETRGS